MAQEDLDAFASRPLRALVEKHIRFDDPAEEAAETMPFVLDAHPAMQHAVAKAMMGRLAKEMRNYAAMHNKKKLPKLIHMDIDGIVEGKKEPSPQIFEENQRMRMCKVFGEGHRTAPRAL